MNSVIYNSLILPEQLLGPLAEYRGEIIDFRPYLKSAAEFTHIPDPISLDRYGEKDISKIRESTRYIENFADSGLMTVVVQQKNVEADLTSDIIVPKLCNHRHDFTKHWKNLTSYKINSIAFIDIERERQYSKLMGLLDADFSLFPKRDDFFLFDTSFLDKSAEDGLSMFKGALREHPAKVVLFDAESAWSGDARRLALFKSALRHCRVNDVAVILILRECKFLRGLPTPDRLIHIWKKGEDRFRYIVETESDHGCAEVEPFELKFKNQKWESETVSPDVLSQIPERENRNKKPGIDASMDLSFDEFPAGDML